MHRATRGVVWSGALMALAAVGCDGATTRWPGPCSAEWTVYETVHVLQKTIATPFKQGSPRVMRWTWSPQGPGPLTMEDDNDGDGTIDTRIDYHYAPDGVLIRLTWDLGGDGSIEQERIPRDEGGTRRHIWDSCQGECTWDDAGNLLEDRDPRGFDVLRYEYGCWTSP